MKLRMSDGIPFYTFSLLDGWADLTQAVFTRAGGVSDPPFDSLNISFAVRDDPDRVRANRGLMARSVGWDPASLVTGQQVHGCSVAAVGRDAIGGGDLPETDALVTDQPGVLLLLKFADCVPIILWDPVRRVVALAHAGWKGTARGIAAATVEFMARRYGSSPSALFAGVGPSIGPCCYQVGPEVATLAERAFAGTGVLRWESAGDIRFDLWSANAEALMRVGVPEESIAIAGICTRCRNDLFFSHRASGGHTGRFGMVAGVRHA